MIFSFSHKQFPKIVKPFSKNAIEGFNNANYFEFSCKIFSSPSTNLQCQPDSKFEFFFWSLDCHLLLCALCFRDLIIGHAAKSYCSLSSKYVCWTWQHGSVYKLAFGPKAFVVVSDPIVARHVLRENAFYYDKVLPNLMQGNFK